MKPTKLILSIGMILYSTNSFADELKIMSWNIANLASEVGVSLRGSHERSEDDFNIIRDIITKADADIIALQEIGSIAAATNVLGSNYSVKLEARCELKGCDTDHGDIYTAIAWKNDLGINEDSVVQVDGLAVDHVSNCQYDETRKVRGGVGLEIVHDEKPYTILSVHLKASCADEASHDPIERPNTQDDCKVLDEQMIFLSKWIANKSQSGQTVIVAGDYNRKFLADSNDRYLQLLNAENPNLRIEPSEKSLCWPQNYPQSRSFRTRLAKDAFKDAGDFNWTPYMPSSIRTRDFFLIAGPASANVGDADEILMRPENLVHNPNSNGLGAAERIAIEQQAEQFGVHMGPPTSYIEACAPEDNSIMFPEPEPFVGSNTVLTFAATYPSDHCPITIAIE